MNMSPKQPNLLYGISVTLLAYLCFATAASIVRFVGPEFPTIQIIFIQNLISLLTVLPYSFKKNLLKVKKELKWIHAIRDVTGVASFFCYFYAIKRLNLVDATLLTYTAPFYTPIVWTIWTREKMEKGIWWTIILGFVGIAFILKPGNHILQAGAIYGFIAGILSSIALVSIRILNQKLESLTRTLFYYFLVGTILTMPFAIYKWHQPSFEQTIMLISIGFLMAVGQLFLTTAYKHGTASFLSPLCYSMIIFTGIISAIAFKQMPGWMSAIGAFLIILGGTISYIIKTKPDKFIKVFEHTPEEKRHWWKKLRLKHERHKKELQKKDDFNILKKK